MAALACLFRPVFFYFLHYSSNLKLSKYIRFQMTALVAFIVAYLVAALFFIAGGEPFAPLVVIWINFVQVPMAIALGPDKPLPGLMSRKPRPSNQPVLMRAQWLRMGFIGLLMAVGTLYLETAHEPAGVEVVATIGFVVFSLFNLSMAISSRSETGTVFQQNPVGERRQLMLYGIALLMIFLPTELGFAQRLLGLTSLNGSQWLLCLGFAFALTLVYEVMKFFLRRSRSHQESAVLAQAQTPA